MKTTPTVMRRYGRHIVCLWCGSWVVASLRAFDESFLLPAVGLRSGNGVRGMRRQHEVSHNCHGVLVRGMTVGRVVGNLEIVKHLYGRVASTARDSIRKFVRVFMNQRLS